MADQGNTGGELLSVTQAPNGNVNISVAPKLVAAAREVLGPHTRRLAEQGNGISTSKAF